MVKKLCSIMEHNNYEASCLIIFHLKSFMQFFLYCNIFLILQYVY